MFLNGIPTKFDEKASLTSPNETVSLNARGFRFKVPVETLDRIPHSRLSKLKKFIYLNKEDKAAAHSFFHFEQLCDFFDEAKNEFYFNKNPKILKMVLGFSNDTRVHLNVSSVCPVYLESELINYWKIMNYEDLVEPECLINYETKREAVDELVNQRREIINEFFHRDDFGKCCFPKAREIIWNFMHVPQSSIYAKVCFI
jgi:hypothetical protein